MKYRVNNLEFKNKKEITNYCRDIMERNSGDILSGDDLEFILEILSYHSRKDKLDGFSYIKVDLDKWERNLCLWIYKKTKAGEDVVDDISWTHCINNIPFSSEKRIDYIFSFGQYKGMSIYDIDDEQYLNWLVSSDWLKRGDKTLINQFIKWGYIPYNALFFKSKSV